ncbi:MAG: hypothetical protein LUH57_01525 [Ruminococcus sp.]|nr:hypothetical protein [Ruminococcus sp.]
MADKFSLDDILDEYSSKARNSREKSDFDVEKLLEETVAKKKSHEKALQELAAEQEAKERQLAEQKAAEQQAEEQQLAAEKAEDSSDDNGSAPTSDAAQSADNSVTEQPKVIRQGDIESVDVDVLVESAVEGVETADDAVVEEKNSGIDIKFDPVTPTASAPEMVGVENADSAQAAHEKKASKRELEREEEQRLEQEGMNAGLNSRFRLRKTSGNTAIIEGLMKLKRERKPVQKDVEVVPVKRLRIKDVDLNLQGKIIPKTEQFDIVKDEPVEIPKDATDTMKMQILSEHRKNKIKNFVLRTDDRDDEEEEKEIDNTVGDFDDYKNAPKVLNDIIGLKNNLTIRLCVLIFTTVFSLYIALANDLGWPIIEGLKRTSDSTFVFVNLILGLISAFVSYTVITVGFKKLFKRQADCDSVAAISIASAVLASLIVLFDSSIMQTKAYNLYMPIAILGLLFNTLGKLLIVNRTLRNFRYVAGEFDKYAIENVTNEDVATKFTKGTINDFPELATMKKTEFNESFLKHSYSTDAADRFCRTYAPLILIVSLIVGLLAIVCDKNAVGFGGRLLAGVITFSGVVSISSSFALMFIVNLPLSRASKKFLQSSAVMLGYSAVEDFADTNSILVDASQLFPEGMVNLVNLKSMSSTPIEECILMAASISCQAGSILKPTFYNMLKGKTELLYPVESYIFEDGLGLSGWIENKRVLFGTRELMENHSIEGLPTKTKEKEYSRGYIPLYLSIGGVVSTLFVIQVMPGISVKKWLNTLEENEISTVIRTVDGFISLGFLADLFEIQPDAIKLLPFRFHEDYERETAFVERAQSPMLCSGHFPSFAMLIHGAKKLQKITTGGIMIMVAGALLGAFIALAMTVFGSLSSLTVTVVMIYNLVWFALIAIYQLIYGRKL